MKVLIAEDDATSLNILQTILTKWGYEVEAVSDGVKALAVLLRKDAPKLAVLDWMMPGLDGVEVCRKVRALNNDNPPYLIILTSRDEKADIVEGLSAGANDYIAKPYDVGELKVRIEVGKRMIDLQCKLHCALEDLSKQAVTDALTSAPNRRGILERLDAEISRALQENTSLWVSILDIDRFKGVNDHHGHLVGDAVIKECIRRIQGVIRPYDAVGRLGGDEFLVIIPSTPTHKAPEVFEWIRTAIADEEVIIGGERLCITVSQGVVNCGRHESEDEIIRKADEALYQVKESGRNKVGYSCR